MNVAEVGEHSPGAAPWRGMKATHWRQRWRAPLPWVLALYIGISASGFHLSPSIAAEGVSDLASALWVEAPGGRYALPRAVAGPWEALRAGRFREAALSLEKGLQEGPLPPPWDGRAKLLLGYAWWRAGEHVRALVSLDRPQEAGPLLNPYAQYYRARALFDLGAFGPSADAFLSLWRGEPEGPLAPEAAALAAESLQRSGDCKGATELWQEYLRQFPRHEGVPRSLLLWGGCLEALADPSGAVRLYQGIWLSHPLREESQEAGARLDSLRSKGVPIPKAPLEALLDRVETLQRAGRLGEALRDWEDLLRGELPAGVRFLARFRSGLNHYYLRNHPGAEAHLNWVIQKGDPEGVAPRAPQARHLLARIRLREGDREGFFSMAKDLLSRHPSGLWARRTLFLMGRVEEDADRASEALGYYQRLTRDHPGTAQADDARWRMGWLDFRAGRWKEARSHFELLAQSGPSTPLLQSALYWAGRSAEALGERTAALHHYREAAKPDPRTYYGQMALARLGEEGSSFSISPASRWPYREPPALPGPERLVLKRADELFMTGLFSASARELQGLTHPYFLYQRARAHYRAGELHLAARLVRERAFSAFLVGEAPRELQEMAFPLPPPGVEAEAPRGLAIDPLLLGAVILTESGFDPRALSVAGARGLLQIMPTTARRVAPELGLSPPDPDHLYDLSLNLRLGRRLLGELLAHFGGALPPALAGYNAGREVATTWWGRWGHLDEAAFVATIPYAETRQYIQRALSYYREYQRIYRQGAGR